MTSHSSINDWSQNASHESLANMYPNAFDHLEPSFDREWHKGFNPNRDKEDAFPTSYWVDC